MPTVRRPLCLLVLAACSLPPDPGTPVPVQAVLPPVATAPADPVIPAAVLPVPELPRTDPARDRQLAADSAADARILDLLDQVEAPDNALLAPVQFDLDVTRWAEHDRVQYYLNFFQGPARERMAIWLARLPRYEQHVRSVLQERGLPGDLAYLALIESGYSNTAVSRSRAVGMWQFMQPTGRMYGLRVDSWVDERRDFVKATDAAARYLADLTKQFGSHFLAAAAYNGGPGRVSRGLDRIDILVANSDELEENSSQLGDAAFFQLSDTRHIHQETKDYVPKLLAATMIAKEPAKYGFVVEEPEPTFPTDSLVVPAATGLDVVARLADVSLAVMRELNPQYLRLTTPPGRTSVIRLPAGSMGTVLAGYAALPAEQRVAFGEHEVRKGETLSGVARRYGVSTQILADANPGLGSRAMLRIGQILRVPGSGTAGSTTAVAASSGSGPAAQTHTVRAGESLGVLSNRYGASVAQLRSWNGLGNSNTIKVGQRLQVSAGAAAQVTTLASRGGAVRTHVVARGETLSAVAARYKVSVRALQDANNLASANQIRVGQRLRVP